MEEAASEVGPGCLNKTAGLIYLALPSGMVLNFQNAERAPNPGFPLY